MSPQRGAPDNDGELTSPHSFVELMSLQRLGDTFVSYPDSIEPEKIERFRSLAIPYNPGQGTRSFGGHVYAQSAYAASKTVGQGLVIHVRFYTSISPKDTQTDVPTGYDGHIHPRRATRHAVRVHSATYPRWIYV